MDKKLFDDDNDREKSRQFRDELLKFNTLHGRENFKVPQIGGKELDLYKLFKEVIGRGGSQVVSDNKLWKEIVNALDLPASCTSASFTLRNHYNRCLHAYEHYYLKSKNNPNVTPLNLTSQPATVIPSNVNQPSASNEQKFLNKKVLKADELNLIYRYTKQPQISRDKTYNKKIRIMNAIPDMKRVVLAFESRITSELVWSINILTLFSANPQCNILIENQPYMLESMTNYIYYCVNNVSELNNLIDIIEGAVDIMSVNVKESFRNKRAQAFTESTTFNFLEEVNNNINLTSLVKKSKNLKENTEIKKELNVDKFCEEVTEYELLEHLMSLINIIRNLSYIKSNEPSIIKNHKLMSMIYLLFIHCNIQEIRYSCLDIITNLSKHIILKEIRYPNEVMNSIFLLLKSTNREIAEQSLECFRRLTFAVGNEEYFERMPDEFFEELVNLLISYKIEIRESAAEIIYCISDQKLPTKTRLGKQYKCIERLVALLSSNSIDNRVSKFAACALANLSDVPSILKIIMSYEQEIILAACTDDSISKTLLGIIST